MTPTHWLALLCLLVQCALMGLVWRWIHTSQAATQAVRELTMELRRLRDTFPPDEEMIA